ELEAVRAKLPKPTAEQIAGWIADLDSNQFAVRQKAYDELEKHIEAAAAALRNVLLGKPALDVRQRVDKLLAGLDALAKSGWVEKMKVFDGKELPDFVQALESSNFHERDNTLAMLGLKVKGSEPLEKFVICRWPQNSEARWGGGNGPGEWQYEP